MKRFLFVFVLVALLPLQSLAGHVVGSGGGGVWMPDGSVQLLDYYRKNLIDLNTNASEKIPPSGIDINDFPFEVSQSVIDAQFNHIAQRSPKLAENLKNVLTKIQWLSQKYLFPALTGDFGNMKLQLPPGQTLVQIATRWDLEVQVSPHITENMPPYHRGGLIWHEALSSVLSRGEGGDQLVWREASDINSCLFTEEGERDPYCTTYSHYWIFRM
jgi:hypothetical protein